MEILPSATLLVARFNEDLEWLLNVPPDYRIILHNKGEPINRPEIERRIFRTIQRPNVGREAESYLHYLLEGGDPNSEWLVFTQGDPFPHSPDFLRLLDARSFWQERQALTCQYLEFPAVPPQQLVLEEKSEYVNGSKVRTELFGLRTFAPFSFEDRGAREIAHRYRIEHSLPTHANIAEHFLKVCGWHALAERAAQADFGRSCYGAIFAIKASYGQSIPKGPLHKMRNMAIANDLYSNLLERLWLHLFDEPFVQFGSRSTPLKPHVSPA